MAVFCTNCGSPGKEGTAFCANCGAAIQGPGPGAAPRASAPPPAPPPTPAAAPLPPRSGSPLLKILLIVLAVIAGLGAVGIIGSIYVIHRVKSSVVTAARNRGVDLKDFTASTYRGRLPDPCSLLTTAEASSILSVTVERAERHGSTCDYYARPLSDEEKEAHVKKAMEEMQARAKEHDAAGGGANPEDASKLARESGVEELTKTMVGSANPGSGPYFSVEVSDNGKAQIAAMKLAMGVVGGGVKVTESLAGIGDEAIMGPMDSMLVFTKGGLGVQIDLRQIPKGRDHAIAMARQMLPRI